MSWFRSKIQKAESKLDAHLNKPAAPTSPASQESAAPGPGTPTPQNSTLLQSFEWHSKRAHWNRLAASLDTLSDIGITSLWLPPGCKANDPKGNGYDCYDLWDLGEFDQKWTKSTKWGSRQELEELIAKARSKDIKVIWDAVLNHKTAGDATEECWAIECDPKDRRIETSRPKKIEPWIHFKFPGRKGQYSSMQWHAEHFSGTDWDQRTSKNAIYKIVDPPESHPRPGAPSDSNRRKKGWAEDVDIVNGNADYLMFSDIDFAHPEVREDMLKWGDWMTSEIGVDGFRLDAVPHMSYTFIREWIENVRRAAQRQGRDLFIVGEFLNSDPDRILGWVDRIGNGVKAYDCLLLDKFAEVSAKKSKTDFDMRKIFRNTLSSLRPDVAVTIVTTHDTQPGQTVATHVEPFFKPLAYALLLLRREGLPCVFYGDLYGIRGPHAEPAACGGKLPALVLSRKVFAYGEQTDYFDSRTSIGWVRHGTWDRTDGCAVIMSIGGASKSEMLVGADKAGQTWTDVLENGGEKCVIDERGFGTFTCAAKSVSVYVRADAPGREQFSCSHPDRFKS